MRGPFLFFNTVCLNCTNIIAQVFVVALFADNRYAYFPFLLSLRFFVLREERESKTLPILLGRNRIFDFVLWFCSLGNAIKTRAIVNDWEAFFNFPVDLSSITACGDDRHVAKIAVGNKVPWNITFLRKK